MIELSGGEVFAILISLLAFVVGIINLVRTGKPATWDAGLVAQLEMKQRDREWMEKLEKAYQSAGTQQQAVLDSVVGVLRLVVRTTPFKADDSVLKLLEDVQTPGIPADATPEVKAAAD